MITKDYLSNWEDMGLAQNIQFEGVWKLEDFRVMLQHPDSLPSIGISYTLENDQIQSGGMFNKKYEDCLVLKTDEIEGCCEFVFTCFNMGNFTKLSVYKHGIGASQAQINKKNRRMAGGALSMIAGMMTKVDESAMEKEYFYYSAVINVIKKCFEI